MPKTRKGSILLELMLAVSVLAVATTVYFREAMFAKQNADILRQQHNVRKLADGIFRNYLILYRYHLPLCEPDGWDNPNCNGLTVFPNYDSATSSLFYVIPASASLSADAMSALVSQLASNLFPVCFPDGGSVASAISGSTVTFKCFNPKINGIRYGLSDGTSNINGYSPAGTGADPNAFPVNIEINYRQEFTASGNLTSTSESIDGTWLYQRMLNESRERFRKIASAMRSYAKTRLVTETDVQGYPNGLHSIDDFYVPWIWESLYSPDANFTSIYTRCTDPSCASIVASSSGWVDDLGIIDYDFVADRLIRNLLSKSFSTMTPYWSDGFLNQIKIIPIGNGCDFADLSSCFPSNNMPPKPQADYFNVYNIRPPFVSYLFTEPCVSRPQELDYCKMKVVYEN